MAFSLVATVGSTSLNLANGSPYRLVHVKGASGVIVRRVTERGPAQVGDVDVGFRLDPRMIELTIGFYATTDAILDGYRDSLTQFFKPLTNTAVALAFTRDDGAIRQIDCYTIDEIKIDLIKEYRPGHYHNATIKLRAPDPAFYNPTPGTVTVTGSAGTATDWYLAGGAIGTASVLMSGGTPAQGEAWSYAGTITTSYTLAFRAPQQVGTSLNYQYAFDVTNGSAPYWTEPALAVNQLASGTTYWYIGAEPYTYSVGTSFMPAGTSNFFLRFDSSAPFSTFQTMYQVGTVSTYPLDKIVPIAGSLRRWRSNSANSAASRWAGTILLYALYSPGLTTSQIAALDVYMAGSVGGTSSIRTVVPYSGNLAEYPVISVTGPITNFYINNVETLDSLYFGTSIGAGTTWVIDTRPGYKTVLEGTVNRRNALAAGSDLDTWHLSPDSSNPIVVYGTNTNAATSLKIVYYNRYSSY